MGADDIHHRIWVYAEGYFQRSGKTEFPTVRMVAKSLRIRQVEVEEAINDDPYGVLMLTHYNTEVPAPIGDWYVETLCEEEEVN